MSRSGAPRGGRGRARRRLTAVLFVATLTVAGCGSAADDAPSATGSAGQSAPTDSTGGSGPGATGDGSGPVVTVPALEDAAGRAAGADQGEPASSAGGSADGSAGPQASATGQSGAGDADDADPEQPDGANDGPGASPDAPATTPRTRSAPGGPPGTPTAPSTGTTSAAASTAPSTGAASAAPTGPAADGMVAGVRVAPSVCAGCTSVIAAAPHVTAGYDAALMATSKSPALISLGPDGDLAGIINVPYGTAFPTPSGRRLPCDSAGRCLVRATMPDGTAVVSAFELTGDGAWRDLMTSSTPGFRSSTARSGVVDVGGGALGIAIQVSGDGQTGWMVLAWSGDRYAPIGCAPDSPSAPTKDQLSFDACLS